MSFNGFSRVMLDEFAIWFLEINDGIIELPILLLIVFWVIMNFQSVKILSHHGSTVLLKEDIDNHTYTRFDRKIRIKVSFKVLSMRQEALLPTLLVTSLKAFMAPTSPKCHPRSSFYILGTGRRHKRLNRLDKAGCPSRLLNFGPKLTHN